MASFQKYLPKLLAIEGGYVADDNGQPANRGILLKTWEQHGPKNRSLRDMTQADAEKIYKKFYWDHFSADYINNQALAEIIVDFGINSGQATAANLVREAMQLPKGAWTAGILSAINRANPVALHAQIKAKRADRYKELAKANPQKYADDLAGWLNRLKKFTIEKPAQKPLFGWTVVALITVGIYALNTQKNGHQTI